MRRSERDRGIFGIDTFCYKTIPYQEGVIFKGNMRGEPEAVHERLTTSFRSDWAIAIGCFQ